MMIFRTPISLAAVFLFALSASAASRSTVTRSTLYLGSTAVPVAVYEAPGDEITFFAPHFNEQIAINLARAAVESRGGRLVSIESIDEGAKPARRIRFMVDGVAYSVDPNRIFTSNGRRCSGLPPRVNDEIERFANQILELLRNGRSNMIIAVHNNTDSQGRKGTDLTASSFSHLLAGRTEFHDQAAGVFLSNSEMDDDNFVLISDPKLLPHFAGKGFNVVLQKATAELSDQRCTVDDGSLSVYSGLNGVTYICLEADAMSGGPRQGKMFDAVYELIAPPAEIAISSAHQ